VGVVEVPDLRYTGPDSKTLQIGYGYVDFSRNLSSFCLGETGADCTD
jgi:hypothetical protein